jgi:hypothetical protein
MPAFSSRRIFVFTSAALLLCCTAFAQTTTVLTTGLEGPYKLTFTASGNLLVSEAGLKDNTGRVSLVTRAGARRSVIEGLPSGKSNPNLTQIGPTGLALRGNTLYIAIAEGDALRNGPTPGSLVLNPAGVSSPIFSCALRVRLSGSADDVQSPFVLSMQNQWTLAEGIPVAVQNTEGMTAVFDVLADFPPVTADPVTTYRHSDPFALALDPAHPDWVFLVDSGQNSLVLINETTGRWAVATRFAPIKNPTSQGPPFMDAVPTSATILGGQALVTLLSGFPFVPGYSAVVAVDGATRTVAPYISWLNSAMDMAYRLKPDGSIQVFVVGFSRSLGSTPPGPGQLWQYDSPAGKVLVNDLVTPAGMVMDTATGEIFITELATGTIKKVQLP